MWNVTLSLIGSIISVVASTVLQVPQLTKDEIAPLDRCTMMDFVFSTYNLFFSYDLQTITCIAKEIYPANDSCKFFLSYNKKKYIN